MSVFCPRSSLSVTATIQEPKVTTLLSSYAPRNKLSACFRSLLSVHNEEIITVHQNVRLQFLVEEMARRCRTSGNILHSPRLERDMLSPSLGCVQTSAHRPFAVSHTRLAALLWGLRLAVGRRRHGPHRRTHVSDGDQESWLDSNEKRLAGTQDSGRFASPPTEVLPRKTSFDPFMTHLRTHQTRTVTWGFGGSFCWHRST